MKTSDDPTACGTGRHKFLVSHAAGMPLPAGLRHALAAALEDAEAWLEQDRHAYNRAVTNQQWVEQIIAASTCLQGTVVVRDAVAKKRWEDAREDVELLRLAPEWIWPPSQLERVRDVFREQSWTSDLHRKIIELYLYLEMRGWRQHLVRQYHKYARLVMRMRAPEEGTPYREYLLQRFALRTILAPH